MKREILFTIIFSFLVFFANQGFSQTSISGIINSYAAVDSIYPTKDTIKVVDASAFSVDDTVMIYQAKGAEPITDTTLQPYNFGNVRTSGINETGKYEIILVKEIKVDTVIFKASLNNDYDTDDLVQLIRVPSYRSANVDEELTCQAWEDSIGGVLALMVSDTLFLNADINVTGKGFKGAAPFLYDEGSFGSNCASGDSALYESYYFNESANTVSAGFKGEGIAKFDTTYRKGLGRWANGGGGGNARFSGGGGGGNDGNGGYGGEEDTVICTYRPAYETNPDHGGYWNTLGGSDGFGLWQLNNDTTIFMGGGGGSGTYTSGLSASSGANGGGIVIIMAKVVKSNGSEIIANGETVSYIADASGAGGGAGGTVVFDVDSAIGSLSVFTNGGDGGRVQYDGKSGPGGGGGGGIIFFNDQPDNVTDEFYGGAAGYIQELWPVIERHDAAPGQEGSVMQTIKVPLTGFLFNSITSDQQVCMNNAPDLISGSEPRGGNGIFTFQWQDSPDGSAWSPAPGVATERDYQPPALSDTIYYKRIVTSGSIVDEGNQVEIIVHDYIEANLIFMPQDSVICIGNEVDTIKGTEVVLGSGGDNISYKYIWEYSFNSTSWVTETGTEDTIYMHGTIADTTYVRRRVISGACEDTASLYNPIIGLPQISNNILSDDQEICYEQIPDEIIGGEPQDGDGSYTIYWEKKTESLNWSDVVDSTRYNFAPAELLETTYYRRIVESDDCFNVSDSIKINVLPLIENNSIVTESLIYTCYNIPPQLINGSTPTGGDDPNYEYQWQESLDGLSWTNIASTNVEDYQADALIVKTYFRRLVSSGQNGCCTSITDTIEVDIYPLPEATIADIVDTICSGDEIILDFTITNGQIPYTLTYNDGETDFPVADISTENYLHYKNPETTLESKVFDYTIVSVVDDNGCMATEKTGLTKITVYGLPVSDAGIDDENCLLSYQLSATPSLGTGIWTQVNETGTTDFNDETSATTIISVDVAGNYIYEWKETNWECPDSNTVEIALYQKPFNVKVSPDDTTLFFVDELKLKGSYKNPDNFEVITTWEILTGSADGITNVEHDSVITFTSLNDLGEEKIIITWTVEKGEGEDACPDTIITIPVKMKELFTPTGFTPNGDGVNDYLKFNGVENSDENELIIYNRWGTEVYRKPNFSNEIGWDGKNKNGNDLPEDTYYYILMVTDDGVSETYKGFIVIKRF